MFYVEQISNEPSPQRNNSPDILNSTELLEHHATRMPSISTIASPQPYIFTINDDSNEPTIPYGFGRQLPIVPPRLNDLNLPPNPFNILATMAIGNKTADANDDNYSPQSPEPSEPSPISTPLMNLSAFNSWEMSDNDWQWYLLIKWRAPENLFSSTKSCIATVTAPKTDEKIEPGNVLSKTGGVLQHVCEACGQTIPSAKDTPGPSNRK